MLPIRLEISNFLAYSAPGPLYFEGIHLACLSGVNGAGKSSILDAITWAIWGQARARSDEELIRMGQDACSVMLDFMQDDHRYRILRSRKRGKHGKIELGLFAYDAEQNRYNNISETGVRETQTRIINLLSLDYETFITSAYIRQGQADAFTTKPPGKRKEILAEILGLAKWQTYEEEAKNYLRDIENELTTIRLRLDEMKGEIAEEQAVHDALEVANQNLSEIEETLAVAQAQFDELAGADKEFQAVQSERDGLVRSLQQYQKSIQDAEAEIERNQKRLAEYQGIIANRENIEAGFNQLESARAADLALGDRLKDLRTVEQRIHELEHQINKAKQDLELEISQMQARIEEAQLKAQNFERLQNEFTHIQSRIAEFEILEIERDTLKQEIENLKNHVTQSTSENKSLKEEMDKIRKRLDQVQGVKGEATCPLCGQKLTEKHRQELETEITNEGKQRGDRYRANQGAIDEAQTLTKTYTTTLQQYNDTLAELPKLRNQMGSLEQQLKDSQDAVNRLGEYEVFLQGMLATVANQDYAHELQEQWAVAMDEKAALAYDPAAHESVRVALSEFSGFQQQATQLEVALQTLPTIEEALRGAEERAQRWETLLAENQERIAVIEETIVALQVKVAEMNRRQQELLTQRSNQRKAQELCANYRQKLNTIEQLRKRSEDFAQREIVLREEASIYEQLRKAFGKDGVPAMLIDSAIPELEETANQLLRKMTSGRMNVRFDTQRDLKSGGVAETFDIWISDELGTRDYSMYSGGEAFRVNFAIRVAISQLLARRAGAQLRTLFIDEGFGTQDEEGRSRLTEAINAVSPDFDLILVITHIDELRDAFPVRIEIEKKDTGSQIRMM